MTAWKDIQIDWATQTEHNNMTGESNRRLPGLQAGRKMALTSVPAY